MQLTTFTDYGLRSLIFLTTQPGRQSSVREIAEYFGISRNHLVKIVHRLSQLGYIASSKGKGGGIRLARDAEEIRIGDVVQQLEPNMELVECFNRETNTCRVVDSCHLRHYLFEANSAFIATLNRYTLADTIKDKTLSFMLTP